MWQNLTPAEQEEWRSLLDPARFYDRKARHVINLPENYFGVAARVATMDFQMGLITDRSYVDDLLDLAAAQFVKGAIYSDDDIPHGRFDRYSQEYARYVYEAAETVGRKDIMTALEPSLKQQFRLWWDLLEPDGYGYPWGRSLGVISYIDTMEIVGFVAEHPQFRPAPLPQLAAAYHAAWESLMSEYLAQRHLLDVFGFGKGHFSYINLDREWQQTTGFYGKVANAHILFQKAMAAEKIESFPARPDFPDVSRFEYFRQGSRPSGVWLVRQGALRFALPITTGTKPGVADYLPSPHGLPGFDVPAEQTVPALTPFLELADGRVYVAGDGADEIRPAADGKSLSATWKRWVRVGDKAGQTADPGLTTTVTWSISSGALVRNETMEAAKSLVIRRISFMFPSTSDRISTRLEGSRHIDSFTGASGALDVEVNQSGLPFVASVRATGNSQLSRGSRMPVLLIEEWEARDIVLKQGARITWSMRLHPSSR
jgi:hypothetical protein